jgi:hypothetical protein
MGVRRGMGDDVQWVDGGRITDRVFYLPPGTETSVVTIDDVFVEVMRHRLFTQQKGTKNIRCTCASSDPTKCPPGADDPRNCQVCNSELRPPGKDISGRFLGIYSTLIEERAYEFKGKQFRDSKLFLEVDKKGGEYFKKQKEFLATVQPQMRGSLVGVRWKVYRSGSSGPGSPPKSPKYGDVWQPMGYVDLMRHFWQSPQIRFIQESHARRGQGQISHEQAVTLFLQPLDYEPLGVYKPETAARYIGFYERPDQGQQQGGYSQPGYGNGGYQAPPMPPAGANFQGAPNFAVPPGQVPAFPGAPPMGGAGALPPGGFAPPPQQAPPGYPPQAQPGFAPAPQPNGMPMMGVPRLPAQGAPAPQAPPQGAPGWPPQGAPPQAPNPGPMWPNQTPAAQAPPAERAPWDGPDQFQRDSRGSPIGYQPGYGPPAQQQQAPAPGWPPQQGAPSLPQAMQLPQAPPGVADPSGARSPGGPGFLAPQSGYAPAAPYGAPPPQPQGVPAGYMPPLPPGYPAPGGAPPMVSVPAGAPAGYQAGYPQQGGSPGWGQAAPGTAPEQAERDF